ncbi:MAG: UvrD-helicase domain-containing protein [Candidatus Omnitrophica bacterium]|nr:UvrD-helicase domain-containing protein [Candidatus Omnitrophota bacterium]
MSGRGSFHSPEVFVCEASAGSGKTYALAERYVRLILYLSSKSSRPPLHSILAITFTNKAAFEMKARIIRFLKELALGVMNSSEEARMIDGLGLDRQQVRVLAMRIMAGILRGYNYFQVQTIDRFINTLLVSSAFQIGLTSAFRIRDDAREYLELAVDELIDEAKSNGAVRKAFDDLLTSILLVEARSAWMPKEVVFETVHGLFKEFNTYARPFVRGAVTPGDILLAKIQVVNEVRAFVDNMPSGIHKGVDKALRKFVANDRRAFLFKDGLSAYFASDAEDIPRFDLAGAHLDQWQKIRTGFINAADLEVRHLYDPYIEVFERVREKLARACLKDDVLFLAELNSKARLIHEQGIVPEELYYRLSTRFEHYLFDEFQDTSLLQWENLRILPEDAIARGGSLFYVGDKKQAIFSFRGGDTTLFDDIRRQYSADGYNLYTHALSESRRSHKAIVDFNNAVFSLDNLQRVMALAPARILDQAELERVYGQAAQIPLKVSPPGCVRVEFLEGKNQEDAREDALRRTVALLGELRQRFQLKDIGILVRKNSDVAMMTRALLEAGIPAASERTLNIKEHPHVIEVAAFLGFLDAPVDNESFAVVVQGEIFRNVSGLSLAAVQDLIVAWRQKKNEPYLYKEFSKAFPAVWQELFEEFFRSVGLFPVYELSVSIFRRWRVLEGFPPSRGFLMHFLELVRAKENDYPSLGGFLRYYTAGEGEAFYVPAAGAEAVRVATVHKAKGLEYSVVILPFFTLGLERGGAGGVLAPRYVLRNVEAGLALYHFNEMHTKFSVLAEEESVGEKMLTFFSELNNAYVALTRAVCEMYVFVPPKSGNSHNMALDLIPKTALSVGLPAVEYPRNSAREDDLAVEVNPPECRDWLSFLKDEFITADQASLPDRQLGIALHEALAKAGNIAPAGWEAFLDSVLPVPGPLTARIRALLLDFLRAPAVAALFSPGDDQVFTEYEVVDRFGRTKRLDRLIVGKDQVVVVDFKTSRAAEEAGAQAQVQEYIRLLREIWPGRRIRGVLAYIIDKEVVDVEDLHG